MNHLNRKRHVVVLSDTAWEAYSPQPPGYLMVGTVQRGEHIGALAMRDGRYFCVNEGRCEPLSDRKIELGMRHATTD